MGGPNTRGGRGGGDQKRGKGGGQSSAGGRSGRDGQDHAEQGQGKGGKSRKGDASQRAAGRPKEDAEGRRKGADAGKGRKGREGGKGQKQPVEKTWTGKELAILRRTLKLVAQSPESMEEFWEESADLRELLESEVPAGLEQEVVDFALALVTCPSAPGTAIAAVAESPLLDVNRFPNSDRFAGELAKIFNGCREVIGSSRVLNLKAERFCEVNATCRDAAFAVLYAEVLAERREREEHAKRLVRDEGNDVMVYEEREITFRSTPVVPTYDELLLDEERGETLRVLRKVIIGHPIPSMEVHVDVLFELMRADFILPLREGMRAFRDLLHGRHRDKIREVRTYQNIVCCSFRMSDRDGLLFKFKVKDTVRNLQKHLMDGSFVVLSSGKYEKGDIHCGTVHRCPREKSGKGFIDPIEKGYFEVAFEGNFLDAYELEGVFCMIESKIFFTPYHRALTCLQTCAADIPPSIAAGLLQGETTVPNYVRKAAVVEFGGVVAMDGTVTSLNVLEEEQWPCTQWSLERERASRALGLSEHVLDTTQQKALRHMFRHNVAVVQGTPGTGKTFIGAKFVQLLLQNYDRLACGPILVVCLTNHALDSFLTDILHFARPQDVARIGRSSVHQSLMVDRPSMWGMVGKAGDTKLAIEYLKKIRRVGVTDCELYRLEKRGLLKAEFADMMARDFREEVQQPKEGWFPTSLEWEELCNEISKQEKRVAELAAVTEDHTAYHDKARGRGRGRGRGGRGRSEATEQKALHPEQRVEAAEKELKQQIAQLKALRSKGKRGRGQRGRGGCDVQGMGEAKLLKRVAAAEEKLRQLRGELQNGDAETQQEEVLWGEKVALEKLQREMYHEEWYLHLCSLGVLAVWKDHAGRYSPDTGIKKAPFAAPVTAHVERNDMDEIEDMLGAEENKKRQIYDSDPDDDSGNETLGYNREERRQWVKELQDIQLRWELAGCPSLSPEERYRFALACCKEVNADIEDDIKEVMEEANAKRERVWKEYEKRFGQNLRKYKVIGATTTGAAKELGALRQVGSKVLMIEEAAEVLESHLLACLTPTTEHVILIGDHRQLRPKVEDSDIDRKKNLGVSTLERLARMKIPYVTLHMQRRMHPLLSDFTKSYYANPQNATDEKVLIEDHPDTNHRPPPKGVRDASRFAMIAHRHPESQHKGTQSWVNIFEVELVVTMAEYIRRVDPKASITILVPYTGQLMEVYHKARSRGVPYRSEKMPDGVLIRTVDNFQGEESDFVVVSLVRSNKPGFLKLPNRACVTLSRARRGMYMVGNIEVLRNANTLWKEAFERCQDSEVLLDAFPAVCEIHRSDMSFATYGEFKKKVNPQGGCFQRCGKPRSCQHQCKQLCHPGDCLEKCTEVCNRAGADCRPPRECDHPCTRNCSENCGRCTAKVSKTYTRCGHVNEVKCHETASPPWCRQAVEKQLPCGHLHTGMCYLWDTVDGLERLQKKCEKRCLKEMACGHPCEEQCHANEPDHSRIKCRQLVKKVLSCRHTVEVECHAVATTSAESCKQQCERVGAACTPPRKCNHPCPRKCVDACGGCEVPVQVEQGCGHTVTVSCCEADDLPPCTEEVTRVHPDCGHKVQGSCSLWDTEKGLVELRRKCKNRCGRLMPCGHLCPQTCHIGDGDDHEIQSKGCTRQTQGQLPCGHTGAFQCNTKGVGTPCAQPCGGVLPCGDLCQGKCNDCRRTGHPPCTKRVERVLVCGHTAELACSEPVDTATCSHPCKAKLTCGHECSGTCGTCIEREGWVHHESCKDKCGRTLPCGHPCKAGCTKQCPPCRELCTRRCEHSSCSSGKGHDCGSCKVVCREPCSWSCPHHQCSLQCDEPCSREPCNVRCPKLLEGCGHRCFGVCGERCPAECVVCLARRRTLPQKFLNFFTVFDDEDETLAFFAEDEVDIATEKCVAELHCGCTFLVGELEQSFASKHSPDEGVAVTMPGCPHCRAPVYPMDFRRLSKDLAERLHQVRDVSSLLRKRYEGRAEQAKGLFEGMKKMVCSMLPDDAPAVRAITEGILDGKPPPHAGDPPTKKEREGAKAFEARMDEYLQKKQASSEYTARQDRFFARFKDETRGERLAEVSLGLCVSLRGWSDDDEGLSTLAIQCGLCEKAWAVRQKAEALEEAHVKSPEREAERAACLIEVAFKQTAPDGAFLRKALQVMRILHLEQRYRCVQQYGAPVADKLRLLSCEIGKLHPDPPDCEESLAELEKQYRVNRPAPEFLRSVAKALGVTGSRFFRCPKGHYYVIGDCGGAQTTGQCPDCGSTVGGTNYTLAEGNTHAGGDVDGERPSWPGYIAPHERV